MDFVVSSVVLVLILSLLSSTWLNLQNSISQAEERRRAVEASALAIDFVVSSPGFPEDWDSASNYSLSVVSNLGLKGSKGISLKKLLAMLNSSDYYALKAKLGLQKYHFRLLVSENFSSGVAAKSGVARQPIAYFASDSRDFFSTLDSSGLVWDYYWGQGSLGQPAWGSSRSQYSGVKPVLFGQMLSNQGIYNTLVIESPEMLYSEANATLVREFLDKGGTIVYLAGNGESELLIQNLGASFRKADSSVDGVVQEKGFFLHNTSIGTFVSATGQWASFSNSTSLEVFVSNSTNSSEGTASAWDYGNGRVYFISDFQSSFNGIQGSDVFNLVGWNLDYGVAPVSTATFVMPQTRFSFIESDKRIPVSVTLVLWNG